MRTAGRIDIGGSAYEVAKDTKRGARFNLPVEAMVAKGTVYLDGLGSAGVADQVCRLALYDDANVLLAVSDEVVVAHRQPPGWVDFPFTLTEGALKLSAGKFTAALHAGDYDGTIRVYGSDPHGKGGKWNADTYADGPSNPFGSYTNLTADISLFLTYFLASGGRWPVESDLYYSRLPLADAQGIFASGGPVSGSTRVANVGWHSTFIDPETGSNALVRDGGEFTDLLGQRIRVSTGGSRPRVVYAYVHGMVDEESFDWDLSLTRVLYGRVGALADMTTPVIVQVIL